MAHPDATGKLADVAGSGDGPQRLRDVRRIVVGFLQGRLDVGGRGLDVDQAL